MRLVACASCHTQYDVTSVDAKWIDCRCGERIENRVLEGVDAQVHRCGSCGAIVPGDDESCAYCGSEIIRDTRDLSLICPECYGRNAEDSRFCTACGVSFQPEAVKVEGFELPCPCCGCLMPVRSVGGIGINECPECNGIWAPDERFDRLVAKAIDARQSADPAKLAAIRPRVKGGNPVKQSVRYRKCPVCECFMGRSNFRKASGVIIDRCNAHGTWLDADELEQIAGFVLSGGRPDAEAFQARSKEDMKRARAAVAFRRAREASGRPLIRTPADGPDPDSFVGSVLNILAKVLD